MAYTSDLTQQEFNVIEKLLPHPYFTTRPSVSRIGTLTIPRYSAAGWFIFTQLLRTYLL